MQNQAVEEHNSSEAADLEVEADPHYIGQNGKEVQHKGLFHKRKEIQEQFKQEEIQVAKEVPEQVSQETEAIDQDLEADSWRKVARGVNGSTGQAEILTKA